MYVNSLTDKVNNISKPYFNPAFYAKNNLGKLLFNNKHCNNRINDSGVYCIDCDDKYIGQTSQSIDTRIKEHSRAFRGISGYSEMADRCINHDHNFGMNNVRVSHLASRYRKLIALETLEIPTYNIKNIRSLNDQVK